MHTDDLQTYERYYKQYIISRRYSACRFVVHNNVYFALSTITLYIRNKKITIVTKQSKTPTKHLLNTHITYKYSTYMSHYVQLCMLV